MSACCSVLVVSLVSLSASLVFLSSAYNLENDAGITIVSIGTTEIFRHSADRPFLTVGRGRLDFSSRHGNWRVASDVTARVELTELEMGERSQDRFQRQRLLFRDKEQTAHVAVDMCVSDTNDLDLHVTCVHGDCTFLWLHLTATPQEHVYGGGEQFTHFNLRGHRFPVWVREQGVGRNVTRAHLYSSDLSDLGPGGDYHTTYFPAALFVSSRRFYCHVAEPAYMELDFTAARRHVVLVHGGKEFTVHMAGGATMLRVLQRLTFHLERQVSIPRWLSSGTVVGLQGGTERMNALLARLRGEGVDVHGLWIQDWSGSIQTNFGQRVFWNWEWNPQRYPGLDVRIKELRKEGVRLLVYITAHLNTAGSVYKSVRDKGYFMKNSTDQPYLVDYMQFDCATVDLTNPAAWAWYKELMTRNLLQFGFGGWMADFGEYIPVDAVWHDGSDGVAMHQKFPVLWAKLNQEVVREFEQTGPNNDLDTVYYMRAGYSGDQNVDFSYSDGLPTTVTAALSLGMSGMSTTHFDIGLYTSQSPPPQTRGEVSEPRHVTLVRTRELFFRSAEMAVFTPVMRTHEGNKPRNNYQFYYDEKDMRLYGKLVGLHNILHNYTRAVLRDQRREGLPCQRPLFLQYDDDTESYDVEHQYLYGSDLLVAPVVDEGVTQWRLYLPPDKWVSLYDVTMTVQGPKWITVDAPILRPPVFYRDSSKWKDLFVTLGHDAKHLTLDY